MSTPVEKSVLLVGADQITHDALTDLGATNQLQVVTVADEQKCLDSLKAAAFDLVITDGRNNWSG